MPMRLLEDLGAPGLVAVADIASTEQKPSWNKWLGIGVAVGSWALETFGRMGGEFVHNVRVSATPWAIENVYNYVREAQGVSSVAMRPTARLRARSSGTRVGRYPAPSFNDEFENVRLV